MQDESFGIIPLFIDTDEPIILLVQHRAGHWGFPKGHAEKNESALETACREFEEETGLSDYRIIDRSKLFKENYTFRRNGKNIDKTVSYFLTQVDTKKFRLQISEIQDARWSSFSLAFETLSFPQAREVLQQVEAHLGSEPYDH